MADITVRNVDDNVINSLTEQAAQKGISREALVKQILDQYVRQIGVPTKGYKGYAANGAEFTIRNYGSEVTATGKNMTSEQSEALKRAALMCQPKNGSKWAKAQSLLDTVGFEIFEL